MYSGIMGIKRWLAHIQFVFFSYMKIFFRIWLDCMQESVIGVV